ncbi:MAG: polysaccharide biosynthesis C-terminal domain-containing protein, partial [Myxococcota bacterium]
SKFAVPVSFVVGAVQKAWLPFKLEIHAKDEDPAAFFRSAVTYYTAGIAYLALGGAVWFPEVLRWVTPNEFAAAAALIPVLVLIPVGRGMYFMLGTGFEVGRDTKPAPLISFAGVVVVVSLTFLFVPWWGAAGAALATVAAWIVMAYIVYRIAQARYPIRYDWASMAAVGGAAFVLAVGAVFAGRAPMVVRLPVNILITLAFPVGVWWVLVRSSTERERMRRLLRHIPVLKRFMRSSRLAGEKQT